MSCFVIFFFFWLDQLGSLYRMFRIVDRQIQDYEWHAPGATKIALALSDHSRCVAYTYLYYLPTYYKQERPHRYVISLRGRYGTSRCAGGPLAMACPPSQPTAVPSIHSTTQATDNLKPSLVQ